MEGNVFQFYNLTTLALISQGLTQAATNTTMVGSIFFSRDELDLCIEENLKFLTLSGEEQWLNKAVYKEICLALDRDGFVAIIPEFDLCLSILRA